MKKTEKDAPLSEEPKKRRLSTGGKVTLIAVGIVLILALATASLFLLKPAEKPSVSAGNDEPAQTGTVPGPEPVKDAVNAPVPESALLKSDLNDEFKYDLYEDYAKITKCLNRTSSVVTVPETIEDKSVLSIGASAFSGCALIEELTLPEALREIGPSAFSGCTGLGYVKLPDSLYFLGDNAFQNCLSLKEVVIPQGVKRIGNYAFDQTPFYEANHDEFFLVGDGVLIGYWGEGGNVTLPDNVKMISSFSYNPGEETSPAIRITGLTLPEGLEEIGDYALTACLNVGTIRFPSTLKTIGKNAFSGCVMLVDVRLPEGLERIDDNAFAFCENLSTISYPKSVTYIGADQFENATDALTRIYLAPDSFAMKHFQSSPYADLIVEDTE